MTCFRGFHGQPVQTIVASFQYRVWFTESFYSQLKDLSNHIQIENVIICWLCSINTMLEKIIVFPWGYNNANSPVSQMFCEHKLHAVACANCKLYRGSNKTNSLKDIDHGTRLLQSFSCILGKCAYTWYARSVVLNEMVAIIDNL